MIGRHNFGEPLDVFMEKPVRDETPQYMTTERHILSKPTMQLLSYRINLNIKEIGFCSGIV